MAEDGGRWRHTWSEVRCSRLVMRPASMAAYHLERAGENNAVWTNAIQLVMVLIGRTELAGQVGLVLSGATAFVAGEATSA
jgi:hypothetical protein